MKKIMIYVSIVLLVIIVTAVIMALSNPLRQSNEQIRERILTLTPLGTSMEDVLKVIKNNKKWEIKGISYESGYTLSDTSDPKETRPGDTVIGKKSIKVCIGKYHNPFETYVFVFWGFDENSKLVGVGVGGDSDAF